MNIMSKAIVSNSEIIKNYKACREKSEIFGKIFILKNNQPDAVLFSVREYERFSAFIEYMESLDENEKIKVAENFPKKGTRKNYSLGMLRNDMQQVVAVDIID